MARRKRSAKGKSSAGAGVGAAHVLEEEVAERFAQLVDALQRLLGQSFDLGAADSAYRRKVFAILERAGKTCVLILLPIVPKVELTPRELQVVALALEGLANKTIARRLEVKTSTVAACLRGVFQKTGIHSRDDLTLEIVLQGQK